MISASTAIESGIDTNEKFVNAWNSMISFTSKYENEIVDIIQRYMGPFKPMFNNTGSTFSIVIYAEVDPKDVKK